MNSSKASLANAKARLEQVKANFTNIEATYNRNKTLFDQKAISQADMDASKAAYEGAKADVKGAEDNVEGSDYNVKSTEASVKEAHDNLAKTNIYSPVDGTVSKLNKEKGERIVGMAQMEGTEIMRLANLNEMEVSVEVNENDIVRVHINDPADIEVDAYSGRKFVGIVTEIANSANTTATLSADQVTNFTVKVRIVQESYKDLISDQNPAPFRPGMSASVEIKTRTVKGTLSVPIMAVTTRIDSSKIKSKEDSKSATGDLEVKNDNLEKEENKENFFAIEKYQV